MIARLARRLRPAPDDAGFSLMEVMVGSAVMATVMAVATGGLVQMYQTADRAEAGALTQTSLTASFSKLDRELRYAYRINDEYAAGADFAVDYVIPDADNNAVCVRLSVPQGGGTLIRRQWPQTGTPAGPEATVGAVAEDVRSSVESQDVPGVLLNPFDRREPDTSSNFDRLNLKLLSTVGLADKSATRTYDLTFTALNTEALTKSLTCTR